MAADPRPLVAQGQGRQDNHECLWDTWKPQVHSGILLASEGWLLSHTDGLQREIFYFIFYFLLPRGQPSEVKVSRAVAPLEVGGEKLPPAPCKSSGCWHSWVGSHVPAPISSASVVTHSILIFRLGPGSFCHSPTRHLFVAPLGLLPGESRRISSSLNAEFHLRSKEPFSKQGNSSRFRREDLLSLRAGASCLQAPRWKPAQALPGTSFGRTVGNAPELRLLILSCRTAG